MDKRPGLEQLERRHNLRVLGDGPVTLLFVHGYGCSQAMWRHVVPSLAGKARIVLLDLVGFGSSDFGAYDLSRYGTLDGHAADVVEILDAVCTGPTVLVGHSVGAMIGLLAELRSPRSLAAHIMVAATPCLINADGYRGGYEASQIEDLLTFADLNFSEWALRTACLIAGTCEPNELSGELARSFCSADPGAARQLARVGFTMDLRAKLPLLTKPTLILQSTHDDLAYVGVGEYLREHIADSQLELIDTVGHCPHLTAPQACARAIAQFLEQPLRA